MYDETESNGFFHCSIKCDKCGNSAQLGGNLDKDFYMQSLIDLGWRLHTQAKKYTHQCGKCSRRTVKAQERRKGREALNELPHRR